MNTLIVIKLILKMKFVLKVLAILLFNITFAQKDKIYVEYNFTNNLNYSEYKGVLISNNNQSIYRAILSNEDEDGKAKLDGGKIYVGGKLRDTYQKVDKSLGSLISYETMDGKKIYAISEEIPDMQWDLSSTDTLSINNYLCNKAILNFRGRDYTAWYSKDIPVQSGPWKFNGLPGLILDISDDTKTYIWRVTKINYPSKENISIPYDEAISTTLKEYVDLRIKNLERMRARVRGALPRGTEFTVPKNSRKGLEVIYEWEEIDD